MYMIQFVLTDAQLTDRVLEGWYSAGITGTTLLNSSGISQRRMRIPGRYAYTLSTSAANNITLIAVVENETIVKACLAATEAAVGDLDKPHTGFFTYWPLTGVKGINKKYSEESSND